MGTQVELLWSLRSLATTHRGRARYFLGCPSFPWGVPTVHGHSTCSVPCNLKARGRKYHPSMCHKGQVPELPSRPLRDLQVGPGECARTQRIRTAQRTAGKDNGGEKEKLVWLPLHCPRGKSHRSQSSAHQLNSPGQLGHSEQVPWTKWLTFVTHSSEILRSAKRVPTQWAPGKRCL